MQKISRLALGSALCCLAVVGACGEATPTRSAVIVTVTVPPGLPVEVTKFRPTATLAGKPGTAESEGLVKALEPGKPTRFTLLVPLLTRGELSIEVEGATDAEVLVLRGLSKVVLSGQARQEVEIPLSQAPCGPGWCWRSTAAQKPTLLGIHGTHDGDGDLYAVGQRGTVLHYNGFAWESLSGPELSQMDIRSVFARSPDQIYLTQGSRTLGYSAQKFTSLHEQSMALEGTVWGYEQTNPAGFTLYRSDLAGVFAFDGKLWDRQPSEYTGDLAGFFGDQNIVWGVGKAIVGLQVGNKMWKNKGSPETGLRGIHGTSAMDIWAVGERGTIMYFDGEVWETLTSPVTADLEAVYASKDGEAWIVGQGGLILRARGGSFTSFPSNTKVNLYGIFGHGEDAIWAVGESGTVLYFDGTKWTRKLGAEERGL